ncbi:di-heme oxidoredictase family protein [Myxococcus sp. AB036A]|uniref:di-heme oxidoredictase family protein n=1 Tax=Myxococcus sp. AB036A TaxID=2562793 RepID=UPI0018917072|nr:di-heme oxidoredictase family protein [Myxococcus sp. AB036A]
MNFSSTRTYFFWWTLTSALLPLSSACSSTSTPTEPDAPDLHDGAASTVTLHGGDAESSRRTYGALSAPERDALLAFLQTL